MRDHGRRARPAGLRRAFFRLPILLYRIGCGGLLGQRFVLVHHVGRRTGKPRQAVVEVVQRHGDEITVAAGFGAASDWYRNLRNGPRTTIELGGRRLAVTAQPLPRPDREAAMTEYAHAHPRAARSLARFMGFSIDGSDADYRSMGDALQMLRFVPDRSVTDRTSGAAPKG